MTKGFSRREAVGALAVCAALPGAAFAQSRNASAQANALYDRLFEALLQASPETATSLGLDTGPRAALRARLIDNAPAARFAFSRQIAEAAPAIATIDRTALPPNERVWLETLAWHAARRAEVIAAPYGIFSASPYVLSHRHGSYVDLPDFLNSQHPVASAADAEAWLSRLEAFATSVGHEVERSRGDAAKGVVPPDFSLDKALTQSRALRAQAGVSSGLAAGLQTKATAAGLRSGWDARAARIVDGPIAAALDRQIELLVELRSRATDAVGMSHLPGGGAFYAMCLRFHTSTDLTAAQAHQRGLEEVAACEARLDELLRAQGLTSGNVGERLTALGRRPDQLWPNTDVGRVELLAFANQRNDAIRRLMPQAFQNPPEARLEIRRVPPTIELGKSLGYAQSGSLDGSRQGAFYINLRDTHDWPRFSIPTLVYHEGIPGHVYQREVLRQSAELPLLFRAALGITAYGEGWGLYAEQLADELGIYDDDPLGRIGYLQAVLYRAQRVVVDTGMHALGWSRPRAFAYMIDKTGFTPGAVANEIERYAVFPGQAASYKLGHSEIVRAREAAKARLGSRFDLRGFHRVVLANGAQPLELLTRRIAAWDGGV